MALSRLAKQCRNCPFVDKCENKRMEALAVLEPTINQSGQNAIEQIGREVVERHAYGQVFHQYEDEIEKEIKKSLYKDLYKSLCGFE